MMDLAVVLTTFVVIFPAELPDKTFVATLVLSTRYKPFLVWIGVVAAFLVQTAVAVIAGGVLSLLPERAVSAGTAVLFAIGSYVLFRGAGGADAAEEAEEREFTSRLAGRDAAAGTGATTARGCAGAGAPSGTDGKPTDRPPARGGFRAVATSFGVLFLAEWGDLSQLLTAGLAARYGNPLSVFVGAWAALACVAAIGVVVGRALLKVVKPSTVRRVAGTLFAILAIVSASEALGLNLPI